MPPSPAAALTVDAVDLEVEAAGVAARDEGLDDRDLRLHLAVVAEVLAGGLGRALRVDRAVAAAEAAAVARGEAAGGRGVRVRAGPLAGAAAGRELLAQAVGLGVVAEGARRGGRRRRVDARDRVLAARVGVVVGLAGVVHAVVVVVGPDAEAGEAGLAGVALAVLVEVVELRALRLAAAVAEGADRGVAVAAAPSGRVRGCGECTREERSHCRRHQARESSHPSLLPVRGCPGSLLSVGAVCRRMSDRVNRTSADMAVRTS